MPGWVCTPVRIRARYTSSSRVIRSHHRIRTGKLRARPATLSAGQAETLGNPQRLRPACPSAALCSKWAVIRSTRQVRLHLLKEFRWRHAQDGGDTEDRAERRALHATFEQGDVGAMKAEFEAKLLLRDPVIDPERAENVTESLSQFGRSPASPLVLIHLEDMLGPYLSLVYRPVVFNR